MQKKVLEQIKNKSIPILEQAEIKKAVLFGSYVRGDNTKDSDIDMLVVFPEDTTLVDVVRLQHTLEDRLQNKVDIVSYNAISPLLRDSILKYQYQMI